MTEREALGVSAAALSALIAAEDRAGLTGSLEALSPEQRFGPASSLSLSERRRLLELIGFEAFSRLAEEAPDAAVTAFLTDFPADDLTDAIGTLPPERHGPVLAGLPETLRRRVKKLLAYGKDTAGGIMSDDFVAFPESETVQGVIDGVRRTAQEQERAFYVYVVDERQRLRGVLSMRDLVVRPPETPVREILRAVPVSVSAGADQEEAARFFQRNRLLALPVVDDQRVLLGIITVDDVAHVLQTEATEDMLKMAGIPGGEESIHAPFSEALKKRLPWLMLNMLLDCVAVSVVAIYQGTIQALVAVAVLMPIISDMGGNTGFQNLSLIVRGLATGEVSLKDFRRILLRQASVGLVMGLVLGLEIALLAYAWKMNPMLGLVAGLAMFANIYIAGLIGAVLPLGMKALRLDPAVSTGPIMTTLTDMSGFFVTLSLANRFLPLLSNGG